MKKYQSKIAKTINDRPMISCKTAVSLKTT